MSTMYTPEEKNKIKNLQVSNSIYRREIKDLLNEISTLNLELVALEEKEKSAVLDEQLELSRKIEQVKALVGRKTGQIKHKEGRIAAKEAEIQDIQTLGMTREDVVVESYNPNDPALLAEKAVAKAASAPAKKTKKEKQEG